MWCKVCNRETQHMHCEVCGAKTENEIPLEIHWCPHCKTPLIKHVNSIGKDECPLCGGRAPYLTTDLRPVFPEERLLLEIITAAPFEYAEKSVWASDNRYYIDGKSHPLSQKVFATQDVATIIEQLHSYQAENQKYYLASFNKTIETFITANRERLDYIVDEAVSFIQSAAQKYPPERMMISFSGGKDSTCTQDLVVRALSNPSMVHVFGNTTLEFSLTLEYVDRFRKANPRAIFKTAKNKEQDFYKVCEDIGPPARMMRWCCSMFKTGPITRVINGMYGDEKILTFYGIRKYESVSRSKYNRLEETSESVKIQKQSVASPIFFWKDIDTWLYILGEKIDFNDAYKLGYDRVGCWCCPNNNSRAQFLSRIYMPEQSQKWRDFLIRFATQIGKPDPEVYVDDGKWKARQGGNGVKAAEDIRIKFTNCTTEDHAKIYQVKKPVDDDFINLFVPFGKISKDLGRRLIHEVIVLDTATNVPIISIQPFNQSGFEFAVKIKTMNVADHDDLQRMIGYQVRKYNACRKCLKCESVCRHGAIAILGDLYYINPDKCKHCKACVSAKYLDGGCLMDKYLKTVK